MDAKSIMLPINLVNDNTGRSAHWGRAASRKKKYLRIIATLYPDAKPFQQPVSLRVTRIVGPRQRLIDADSIGRGSAKELIDALVDCGFLHDDGPKWVTGVEYRQEVDRVNGPGVRVEFL